MNIEITIRSTRYFIFVLAMFIALSGCVATVGGDGYGEAAVGYDVGFYEPFGYDYGGWGPGYRVGPPRVGYSHSVGAGRDHWHPAYRAASPSRSMPSIPTHERSGQRGATNRRSH